MDTEAVNCCCRIYSVQCRFTLYHLKAYITDKHRFHLTCSARFLCVSRCIAYSVSFCICVHGGWGCSRPYRVSCNHITTCLCVYTVYTATPGQTLLSSQICASHHCVCCGSVTMLQWPTNDPSEGNTCCYLQLIQRSFTHCVWAGYRWM